MDYLTQIADKLALDALDAADAAGDETIVDEVSKTVFSASPTVQEAFMTAVRFRRAERRARMTLGRLVAQAGLQPEKYGCNPASATAEPAPAPKAAPEAPAAEKKPAQPASPAPAAPQPAAAAPAAQPQPKPTPAAQPQPKPAQAAQPAPTPDAEPEEPAKIIPRSAPRSPFRKVDLEGEE